MADPYEPSTDLACAEIASGIGFLEGEVGLAEPEDVPTLVEWIDQLLGRLSACRDVAESLREDGA